MSRHQAPGSLLRNVRQQVALRPKPRAAERTIRQDRSHSACAQVAAALASGMHVPHIERTAITTRDAPLVLGAITALSSGFQ
jgi:hypothetical protein